MATYSEYLEFFRRHRNETSSSKTLAYALLFKKTGSGYSTVGTKKLIDSEGESVGLISGGCLEPEIVLHAQEVIRSGVSKKIILNTRSPEDRFFGSGAGCEGELSIFIDLLPLNIKEGDLLLHFLGVEKPGFLVHDFAAYSPLQRHRYTPHFSTPDDFNEDLFVEETKPVPNALIVGAHPDSLALYQLTQFLGWRSCHRL